MCSPAAAAVCGWVALLLSVSAVRGQFTVSYAPVVDICTSKGSATVMLCFVNETTRLPVAKTFWFTQEVDDDPFDLTGDSDYNNRISSFCSMPAHCGLTIRDLKESDSNTYRCVFIIRPTDYKWIGEAGVNLTVTALQVKVISVTVLSSHIQANLSCSSICGGPSYRWSLNRRDVPGDSAFYTGALKPGDGVSCRLMDDHWSRGRSPSPTLYALKVPSVSVRPSGDVREGSAVTLSCSMNAIIAANYTWFKEDQPLPPSEDPQLVFSSIQASDSGHYSCAAENQLGKKRSGNISIDVKYAPRRPSVSLSPSPEVVEGRSVTLNCSSDANPAANYTWYKVEMKSFPHRVREDPQLVFRSIHSSDSGLFYCKADNHLGTRISKFVSIDVKYAPRRPSVSVCPSPEVVEGGSVSLSCSSDANPAASYTWYKGNQTGPLGGGDIYRFTSIRPEDRGMYGCKAVNPHGGSSSSSLSVDVQYAPRRPSVSLSPSPEVVEGHSVTLNCSSDANPAASYTWYKVEMKSLPHRVSEDPQLVLRSIQSSDSGLFYCKADNYLGTRISKFVSIDVKYAPRRPSVSVSPSPEVVEGRSVTLSCSSDANPAANYTWYKGNQTGPLGGGDVYRFTSIRPEDRGMYGCKAVNPHGGSSSSSLSVDVQYAPRRPSVSVSPSPEVVEGRSVTLNCSSDANPAASYTWHKVDEKEPAASGPIFIINVTREEHSGRYRCDAENNRGRSYSTLNLEVVPINDTVRYIVPEICATRGATTIMICEAYNIFYPSVTEQFWFTKEVNNDPFDLTRDSDYKGRATNSCPVLDHCGLVIRDLKESDSKTYRCVFFIGLSGEKWIGETGVNLTITALQVKVISVTVLSSHIQANLSCSSICGGPFYRWSLNRRDVPGDSAFYTGALKPGDGVSCRLMDDHWSRGRSPSPTLYAPKVPSVSVRPSGDVREGSAVTLSCSMDAIIAGSYTWYKEDQPLPPSEDPQLVFSSIQASDSGHYSCAAENQLGKKRSGNISIDVKYAPRRHSVSASPSPEVEEGGSVTLSCSSDANPAANYTWHKGDEEEPAASGPIFLINDFRAGHGGRYRCDAQNNMGSSNSILNLTLSSGLPEGWMVAVVSLSVILSLVVLVVGLMWMRRRRALERPPDSPQKPAGAAQKQPAEEESDLHYASVQFSKKPADPVDGNITPPPPPPPPAQRRPAEDAEGVEYAALTFRRAGKPPGDTPRASGEEHKH